MATIKVTATVRGKRLASRAAGNLGKTLQAAKATEVVVGFPAGKTGSEIVSRAVWNEFGTTRIPERPFFRNAMRDNRSTYGRMMKAGLQPIMKAAATGVASEALLVLFERLGLKAQGDIQRSIVGLKSPPNAASTIAQKGSSNPLIDTGEMRQRVTYDVRSKTR